MFKLNCNIWCICIDISFYLYGQDQRVKVMPCMHLRGYAMHALERLCCAAFHTGNNVHVICMLSY